jgi:hypothetical protein
VQSPHKPRADGKNLQSLLNLQTNIDTGTASVASKEGKIDGVSGASEGEKQDGGDNDAYEVEKLVQMRKTKGAWNFLVKWVGYDSTENSWVMYSDLVGD